MVGLGVYDALARDIIDTETGEVYPALSCYNDKAMAERCTSVNAPRVIWSIKANAQMNSDCAVLLREGFKSGKIRLLETEYDGEDTLSEMRGYNSLSQSEKLKLLMPYINTTLLVNELIKLQHEETSGKVRIYERAGMRKDRYSSLAYNYYVSIQLEAKYGRRRRDGVDDPSDAFLFRAPKIQ